MRSKYPRIVIAGTNSGVGKTTIVTGLLASLHEAGLNIQPFKVGPDYIDPGFHSRAAGRVSCNLDTWMVPPEKLQSTFTYIADDADLSVIEGVMGLYDGGKEGISSTAEIAKRLDAPVILVIDCRSVGASAAAVALGYREYDPDVRMAGVILNKLGSETHEDMIREAMKKIHMPVLGAIHRMETLQTPERHLGLTPVTEIDPDSVIHSMKEAVTGSLNIDRIVEIAQNAPSLETGERNVSAVRKTVRIGVASDEAFSFYYPTSLAALERMGAELIRFSPLTDTSVPDADGLIFGGGFPEMFLDTLRDNTAMQESIRQAAAAGMPIYAECGGLMYLCRSISDFEGRMYPMTGLVPADCRMQKKLQYVGYVKGTALRSSVLADKGDVLTGHEFHFSLLDGLASDFPYAYSMKGTRRRETHAGGYANGHLLASYLHLSFDGNEKAGRHFITECESFRRKQ